MGTCYSSGNVNRVWVSEYVPRAPQFTPFENLPSSSLDLGMPTHTQKIQWLSVEVVFFWH